MVFNSIDFLIFFPVVTLLYFAIPKKIRYVWLLVSSYYFYMCWNASYAILLFISTFSTYASGIVVDRLNKKKQSAKGKRKLVLAICMLINFGILFVFKYFNFTMGLIESAFSISGRMLSVPRVDVLLPVGISFYIFQAAGYMIDVYRGDVQAERNFLKYALFVSFFPQLVAGPIERSKNLLAQIQEPTTFSVENARMGLLTMAYGLFLKVVVADNLCKIIDPIFEDYTNMNWMWLALAIFLFAFQIYCDFQGYSQLAIGCARVLGYRIRENFDAPYLAVNVRDFWRRWHMSLNTWFVDYLYIPLGGNRGKWQRHINTLIVFGISGLWHGANIHFVVWGALNGIYVVLHNMTDKLRSRLQKAINIDTEAAGWVFLSRITTFVLVDFAWLFFRTGIREAVEITIKIVREFRVIDIFSYDFWNLLDFRWIFTLAILGGIDYLWYKKIDWKEILFKQQIFVRWTVYIFILVLIIMWGAYGEGYEQTQFIYFQF